MGSVELMAGRRQRDQVRPDSSDRLGGLARPVGTLRAAGQGRTVGVIARIAASARAPALAGAVLGALAVAEAFWRAAASSTSVSWQASVSWPLVTLVLALPALATTVPLGLLWSQPSVAAVVIASAAVLSLAGLHTLTVAALVALLVILYRLGSLGPAALVLPLAAVFPVLAIADPGTGEGRWLTVLAAALAPAAAIGGVARRARVEARAQSAANQMIAGSLLEHAARGERARIARELHDVVAHHISMVAVQAETARLTTPGMPEAGAQRLSAIGDTARAALTEMRRLLGVLREDAEAEPSIRQPQPGLPQLAELVDVAREVSGTGTRMILRGGPVALDPGVELAAYRIVQEALTNARRHAPGAAVDVEVHYAGGTIELRVRDNGPGPRPAGPDPAQAPHSPAGRAGLGLTGMRERAAAVGGELRIGPAAGGGFLVEASLPATGEADS